MHSSTVQLLSLFAATASAAFGPAFSTGPVSNGNLIKEAVSTLIVPQGNLPFAGFTSLWVGMGTSNGDLIQSILDRHPGDGVAQTPCETVKNTNEWCGFTYTLKASGFQDIGPQARVVAGDHLTSRYVYDYNTKNYTQYLGLNGRTVATLTTSSGLALGFGTAMECAATDCGTVPAHQWINTVITMDKLDPNYGKTQGQAAGVTNSGFSTADDGKTWKVSRISIPKFSFVRQRRPRPA